jgi:glycosyltransferase involved in cell wall biosynthesis
MMKARGHEIIHYGHEDSEVDCDEHVTLTTNADLEKAYGSYDWRNNFFKFNTSDHAYQTFFRNGIAEVAKRKKPLDFLLAFWGSGVRPICDAHDDMIVVEPGIGYAGGHWAKWKVFESYALLHAYGGLKAVGTCNPTWYDVVIPNYFDLDDFTFKEEKQDYFLFLGRVYSGKGVDIAVQVTKHIGAKLKIAGQNPENRTFPKHVEFVGYADVETRRELMANAMGSFVCSTYVEPFGGVQVENLISGTPTITTDWGAFTENNHEGITGYRGRTFEDFVKAAEKIRDGEISPYICRMHGERFSLENIAPQYEKYFQDVLNTYTGRGWYQIGIPQGDPVELMEQNQLDQQIKEERPFADNLAKWMCEGIPHKEVAPPKVIHFGAKSGVYVDAMHSAGLQAIGYEENKSLIRYQRTFNVDWRDVEDKADIVLCIEMGQKVQEIESSSLVRKILDTTNKGGLIIFSSAMIGQTGDGHINLQHPSYWNSLFMENGGRRMLQLEDSMKEFIKEGYYMGWFTNNAMIFEKK